MGVVGGGSLFLGTETILVLYTGITQEYLHCYPEMIKSLCIIQVKGVLQPLLLQTCKVNSFLVEVLVEVGFSDVELRTSFIEYYSIG
jgi:hypothetical protein